MIVWIIQNADVVFLTMLALFWIAVFYKASRT